MKFTLKTARKEEMTLIDPRKRGATQEVALFRFILCHEEVSGEGGQNACRRPIEQAEQWSQRYTMFQLDRLYICYAIYEPADAVGGLEMLTALKRRS